MLVVVVKQLDMFVCLFVFDTYHYFCAYSKMLLGLSHTAQQLQVGSILTIHEPFHMSYIHLLTKCNIMSSPGADCPSLHHLYLVIPQSQHLKSVPGIWMFWMQLRSQNDQMQPGLTAVLIAQSMDGLSPLDPSGLSSSFHLSGRKSHQFFNPAFFFLYVQPCALMFTSAHRIQ